MFKSKSHALIIPQSEHLRLAGELAMLWGNSAFELPPLPRLSLLAGIALHDRGYGYLDNIAIGGAPEKVWLEVTRQGFFMPCSDPITDLVVRHHLLRLVSGYGASAAQAQLAAEMRLTIQQQLAQYGLDAALFAQVDRMTQFCDAVAFDFCWGEPAERQVEVFHRYAPAASTPLRYRVSGNEIELDPWPLAVHQSSGYLLGCRPENYPQTPDSIPIPYFIRPFHA